MNKLIVLFFIAVGLLFVYPKSASAQMCSGSNTSSGLYRCTQNTDRTYTCNTSGTETSSCAYSSFSGDCRASVWVPENCDINAQRTQCAAHNKIDGLTTNGCTVVRPTLPPTTTASSTPTPTQQPGWGGCGSCNTCGHSGECVLSPEGACLWDPGSCSSPALPFCRNVSVTPSTITAYPGEEVSFTVNWEGTAWPPGSAQNGGVIFRPTTPGIFQMRGGIWGPYSTPPNSYYTNTLSWPYKNFYAFNNCCGDSWGAQTFNAVLRANNVGSTTYAVGIVQSGGPRIDDVGKDAPDSTWNSANSCIGYATVNVISPPTPSCSVTATPVVLSMATQTSQNVTANVTAENGTVSNVTFSYTPNSGSAVVTPSTDNALPYSTSITPSSPGSGSIRIGVQMGGIERCSTTVPVNVSNPPPFIGASDGDIISNGIINIELRPSTYLINRTASTEGIGIYRNILNLGSGQISIPNWRAAGGGIGSSLQYDLLREQVPSGATITNLNTTPNFNSIRTGGNVDSEGYIWYEANGNTTLTINGNAVFPGNRKAVVFVDGDLTITGNGTQTFANVANSFLMFVVRGDVRINPGIGHSNSSLTSPNLSAIFYSGGKFITDSGSNRLNILGTVVALQGVSLSRDVVTSNPSEYFIFSPELIINYPPALGIRRAFWREVQP